MNQDILKYYFTDQQVAAILGVTLGGFRNKIYRRETQDLPASISVMPRTRLWSKKEMRAHLMTTYKDNETLVDSLLQRAEKTGE